MSELTPTKITVLLADDHPLARAGIRNLLVEADDLEIIGEAEDGFQAQELVAELRPNVLLLDLKMPGLRPSVLEKWVRENYPETITLVLTSHDRDNYLAGMMDAGVSGYMNKDISSERLIGAIRRAVQGEILFDQNQMQRIRVWKENVKDKLSQLTPQENETLKLLAKGLDNKAIASALLIMETTVNFHVTNTLRKLSLKNRQEVVIWALKYLSDNLE
jgi:DNA-binding NarL/FixJ family response regulator